MPKTIKQQLTNGAGVIILFTIEGVFMWQAVLDALVDSLKTLPILFLVYLMIEFIEHKGEVKFEKIVASSKKYGPLWGAGLGCIPQCGFSAVMADLYNRKMITIGTLFAVFIATSDEAFALLISKPNYILSVLVLIGIKLVLAVVIGYAIDLIFRKQNLQGDTFEHSDHFEHEHSHSHTKEQIEEEKIKSASCETCEVEEKTCGTCEHNHLHHHHELENETTKKKSTIFWHIVLQAFIHTIEIFLWILIANLFITVLLQLSGGENTLKTIMGTNAWYQPFVCAFIGLIPNCAGSVALVELYMEGIISFASCIGGLCSGAGIGLIILFKNKKGIKQNLLIMLALYLIGVVVGLLFNLFLPASI